MLLDLEPYALCNATNFEDMVLLPPLFEIEPFDDPTRGGNTDIYVHIIETRMGTYHIKNTYIFASIKYLGHP